MQVQKHARIANIRKLSRYFLFLVVAMMFMTGGGGFVLSLMIAFGPIGDLTLTGFLVKSTVQDGGYFALLLSGMTVELKVISVIAVVSFFAMIEFILIHTNQLLTCFYEGEIFNKKAVFHAKKVFNFNLILVGGGICIDFLSIILSCLNPDLGGSREVGRFIGGTIDQLVWIGFFLLLLWSLEIGVDLNEEAELTI
ncbi:hypothetical protein ACO0LM_06600 [Undibacterium sp. Di26W]|uniref:hypothetical protein n=1 Tax=Undibacterium sp. Di26W TaxID=3413035 RepID=UPI003BF1317E